MKERWLSTLAQSALSVGTKRFTDADHVVMMLWLVISVRTPHSRHKDTARSEAVSFWGSMHLWH